MYILIYFKKINAQKHPPYMKKKVLIKVIKMNTSKKEPQENLPILRVIKSASCPTLTGTSELSYHIAVDAEKALYLKLSSNTGNGHFSNEYIAYNDAKSAFPLGPTSSIPLRKLFKNKSLNSSGFLLAILLNLGIAEPFPGKLRRYQTCSDEAFLKSIDILIQSGEDLSIAHTDPATSIPPPKPRKKTQSTTKSSKS
ncbi:MAG: hypothetical protein GYB20_20160 [Oceanospirillales bacterium]|nr:hypothetical protein [Oceanospirillales bacterium]